MCSDSKDKFKFIVKDLTKLSRYGGGVLYTYSAIIIFNCTNTQSYGLEDKHMPNITIACTITMIYREEVI